MNPFPQLVPLRVHAVLARLQAQTWSPAVALPVEATAATARPLDLATARRRPRRATRSGDVWGRLYDQRWCRVAFPAASPRSPERYLEWRDQAEATLYFDGEPYYGFDVAHRRVALPPSAREAWIECTCVQSAIWHPDATGLSARGSVFGGAFLTTRDDDAWHAALDLRCLLELAALERPEILRPEPGRQQTPLTQVSPLHRQLMRALEQLCDAFDRDGARAVRTLAASAYRELRQEKSFVRAVLTGHAHIDLVWLWPERVGETKAVHTFATMNRLMELYPEFRFAYSQPASYAAVARRAPGLHRTVRRRIAQGRWQATGAMFVESDTLLACGEALARSFMCGQEDFAALTGRPSPLLWLPDVFGYAGCLPQLMRLAGVEHFYTTKLMWNAINRFPHTSFVWRGTDGSEVLAHLSADAGYNNVVSAAQLTTAARGHAQADVHREFLHPTGYGDGGGGTTEEMCERARRLDALPGLPSVRWGHPEEFFQQLRLARAELPVYQGELYLEYHRGTYTTHGRLKAAFRAAERALQVREAAAVALGQRPDLGATWRRLVFAQFHDYIPGSSVPEVYTEALPELTALAETQLTTARDALGADDGDECVFNPLPLPRQVVHRRRLLAVPALGGVRVADATVREFRLARVADRALDNGRVRARFDARGELAALTVDGETVTLERGAGRLITFPDRAANFDAWDIDRHVLELGESVRTPVTFAMESDARGLRATLVMRRRIGAASAVTLRWSLEAESPVLRVDVELDWREPERLLKLVFPTGYRGTYARCGAPFGSVQRPQQPGAMSAEAMWEIPASRHVTALDDAAQNGFSVLAEAKYGFSVRDGAIGVSLVRSPRHTGYDAGHAKAYPAALSRVRVDSPFTDQGLHEIRLALARFSAAAPRAEQPAALAETLFTETVPYRGAPVSAPGFRGLNGGESLVPCWAQPLARGAWVLRLHEVAGANGTARLDLAAGWTARKIDLRGQSLGPRLTRGTLAFRAH